MNELIKITEKDGKQLVSARELYKTLGYADGQFSRWGKANISENPFAIEGEDYTGFDTAVEGNLVVDYALVIPFAKKISMMAKTEVGDKIRDYFLECERTSKGLVLSSYQIEDPIKRAEKWIEEQKEKQQLQIELKENEPKVLFANAVIGSKSSCLIGELAKIITQNGYEIGQNRLFQWMRDNKYLGTRGENYNIPLQQFVEQGLFELKKGVRSGNDGVLHTTITVKCSGKGQSYFINKFLGNNK